MSCDLSCGDFFWEMRARIGLDCWESNMSVCGWSGGVFELHPVWEMEVLIPF